MLRLNALGLAGVALGIGACGPSVETEDSSAVNSSGSGTESTSPSGPDSLTQSSTTTDTDSTTTADTTADADADTDTDTDTDDPPLTNCPIANDDLGSIWMDVDAGRERGEAVAVAGDRVAWVASDFSGTRLRVYDLDGTELWAADVDASPGEGALRQKGVGTTGLRTVFGASGASGTYVRVYDADGAELLDVSTPLLSEIEGVAMHGDGSFAVAGSGDDDMLLEGFAADGASTFSQSLDAGAGEFSAAVATAADGGLFVAGHSNGSAAPVYARLDADGQVVWVVELEARDLDVAHDVAPDGNGGAFFAVDTPGGGRIDHLDETGESVSSFDVEYFAESVSVDADGRLAVAGRRSGGGGGGVVILERRAPNGDLLQGIERPGSWGFAVATDANCDLYLSGAGDSGAFLEKLD